MAEDWRRELPIKSTNVMPIVYKLGQNGCSYRIFCVILAAEIAC
jgi:hypothetical protein